MTHSRSAEKRVRQAEERRVRNRSIRGATRTQVRKALPLISASRFEEAEAAIRVAVSSLDKAAEKGILHPNNAARHKSRLMLKYNAAVSAAATAPAPEPAKPVRRTPVVKKAAPARAAKTPEKAAPKKASAKKPAAKKPAPKKPAAKPKKS